MLVVRANFSRPCCPLREPSARPRDALLRLHDALLRQEHLSDLAPENPRLWHRVAIGGRVARWAVVEGAGFNLEIHASLFGPDVNRGARRDGLAETVPSLVTNVGELIGAVSGLGNFV